MYDNSLQYSADSIRQKVSSSKQLTGIRNKREIDLVRWLAWQHLYAAVRVSPSAPFAPGTLYALWIPEMLTTIWN